jgi:hypothetical protein
LDALNNSRYLADRCKTDWSFINTIFPGLSLKETHVSNQKLKDKVYAGAKIRYGEVDETIRQRIEYELDLITQKGFAPYFLIVQDIVMQTRATIGRGSAAALLHKWTPYVIRSSLSDLFTRNEKICRILMWISLGMSETIFWTMFSRNMVRSGRPWSPVRFF